MLYSAVIRGNPEQYKLQVLKFACTFENTVMLDSNSNIAGPIPYTGKRYNYIAAAGIADEIRAEKNCLEQLEAFIRKHEGTGQWIFGCLSYDLKNEIEDLESENPDAFGFPVLHFIVPRHTIIASEDQITLLSDQPAEQTWNEIICMAPSNPEEPVVDSMQLSYIPERDNYLNAVKELSGHIRYGNIYEVNYCHQLLAKAKQLNVPVLFQRLNAKSPNPFASYFRAGNFHLMCASPERFLAKRGQELISQPVKGTAPRGTDSGSDNNNRDRLLVSEKERAENIMIADLVRNDLSRVAAKGSVRAEELCGAYTYLRVHQLISTITCQLQSGISFSEIIRALFPMGSMTGAPKISAMKLIEKFETFRRSAFSGAVGYIAPDGDFDFNVVIRSILYNNKTGIISIAAGSAITAASNPMQEFEETFVKLAPQLEALGIRNNILTGETLDEKSA